MTHCHVCERLREPEDDYLVAMRNHLYVDACFRCWFMWPDAHKIFPPTGYGRSELSHACDNFSLSDVIDVLGATA